MIRSRTNFRPSCPKCGSLSVGYERDARAKDRHVVCLTCSNRIYGDEIDRVFSLQLSLWLSGENPPCLKEDCENPQRDNNLTCSDQCSEKWIHSRRWKSRLSDI